MNLLATLRPYQEVVNAQAERIRQLEAALESERLARKQVESREALLEQELLALTADLATAREAITAAQAALS